MDPTGNRHASTQQAGMSTLRKLVLALVLFGVLTTPAYAYIDPGSGSMVLQGVLAAVVAIAVTAKLWWHRLLVLVGIRKRTLRTPTAPADQRDETRN
jgi:hypothetical protein